MEGPQECGDIGPFFLSGMNTKISWLLTCLDYIDYTKIRRHPCFKCIFIVKKRYNFKAPTNTSPSFPTQTNSQQSQSKNTNTFRCNSAPRKQTCVHYAYMSVKGSRARACRCAAKNAAFKGQHALVFNVRLRGWGRFPARSRRSFPRHVFIMRIYLYKRCTHACMQVRGKECCFQRATCLGFQCSSPRLGSLPRSIAAKLSMPWAAATNH